MSRTTREILLARGYTEADLATMDTLLKDQKFCAAIEAEAAAADAAQAEQQRLNELMASNEQWYETVAKPALVKTANEAAEAKAQAAAAEARLKAAQEYGLARVAAQQDGTPPPPAPAQPNSNPAQNTRAFTEDDFNSRAAQFGKTTAVSQAQLQDIADEHRELFGSRLPGGMSGLMSSYHEAIEKRHYRGSLRDYWSEQHKVGDKRAELESKSAAEREAKIRADERSKVMAEVGSNPHTRPMRASNSPFTNRPAAGQGARGDSTAQGGGGRATQPWERNANDRSSERTQRAASKFLQQ